MFQRLQSTSSTIMFRIPKQTAEHGNIAAVNKRHQSIRAASEMHLQATTSRIPFQQRSAHGAREPT
jgi:hypothetical protein